MLLLQVICLADPKGQVCIAGTNVLQGPQGERRKVVFQATSLTLLRWGMTLRMCNRPFWLDVNWIVTVMCLNLLQDSFDNHKLSVDAVQLEVCQ